MKFLAPTAIAILMVGVASLSFAEPAQRISGDLQLMHVPDLNQNGIGPELIGGAEANTNDWPASFYSASAGGRCSATLVGPRALLLAAHCMGPGRMATIEIGKKKFSGPCTHADGYKNGAGDDSEDYALCRLTEAAPLKLFESINRDPARIVKGNSLLLTGYGCTQAPKGGGGPSGGNDGKFRTGEAPVVSVPGDSKDEPNTILTRHKVMVCPGDSGGGAYLLSGARRLLVAVNSRVWYAQGESYLSSMSSTDGIAFVDGWIKNNGDEGICGVSLKGKMCR